MRTHQVVAPGYDIRLTTRSAIFVAAFVLRMAVPVFWPGIHYPDEVMQSLEQAHRLVFGNGSRAVGISRRCALVAAAWAVGGADVVG